MVNFQKKKKQPRYKNIKKTQKRAICGLNSMFKLIQFPNN